MKWIASLLMFVGLVFGVAVGVSVFANFNIPALDASMALVAYGTSFALIAGGAWLRRLAIRSERESIESRESARLSGMRDAVETPVP
jgi:hypothetical protein